jgi:glycerol-3-phosphate acyltransferase PlsY
VGRVLGVDVRRHGSGNIGASNVLRAVGRGPAILTLVGDVAKGFAAACFGGLVGPEPIWLGAAAVLAVVGNCWSVFLGFRGGKGAATGLGAFLRVTPWAILPAVVVFVVLAVTFRYASLASLCAAAGLPLAALALGYSPGLAAVAAVGAVIVIGRHHANIGRLLAGTERRIGEREPTRG